MPKIFILKLIIALNFISGICYSQTGIGASGIYNFQTTGIGFGVRLTIPATERFSFVPQLSYFPSFNIVNEAFVSLNLHYNLILKDRIQGYVLAGGSLNYWINAADAPYKDAKTTNLIPEIGGGILFGSSCFKPFVEHQYNVLWKEGSLHIGFLWFPGCDSPKDGLVCPAYF